MCAKVGPLSSKTEQDSPTLVQKSQNMVQPWTEQNSANYYKKLYCTSYYLLEIGREPLSLSISCCPNVIIREMANI